MDINKELRRLDRMSKRACRDASWVNTSGLAAYRLLYSSARGVEERNGYMILGANPGGTPNDIRRSYHTLPFSADRYSGYLDDEWIRQGVSLGARGNAPMQRRVQEIAMVLTGSGNRDSRRAAGDYTSKPTDRIGEPATEFLYSTPSGNVIPFVSTSVATLNEELRAVGYEIGRELIQLAQPRVIILLGAGGFLNKIVGPREVAYGPCTIWHTWNYQEEIVQPTTDGGHPILLVRLPAVNSSMMDQERFSTILSYLIERGKVIDDWAHGRAN